MEYRRSALYTSVARYQAEAAERAAEGWRVDFFETWRLGVGNRPAFRVYYIRDASAATAKVPLPRLAGHRWTLPARVA